MKPYFDTHSAGVLLLLVLLAWLNPIALGRGCTSTRWMVAKRTGNSCSPRPRDSAPPC